MFWTALFVLVASASALPPFIRVPVGTVFGPSGYVLPKGRPVQFTADQAQDIVVSGPSGVVTSSGRNVQFFVPVEKRHKRAAPSDYWTVGASGAIGQNNELVQFKEAGTHLVVDGPSGAIFSDGTQVQKRSKRAAPINLIGHGGFITRDGRNFQLPPGVSVVLASDSGIILSNGQNVQLNRVD